MTVALIVGLAGAALGAGGVAAWFKIKPENRRTNAEADVTLGEGWKVLWDSARVELNEMRERLALVEDREAECRQRLANLERADGNVEQRVLSLIDKEIAKRAPN